MLFWCLRKRAIDCLDRGVEVVVFDADDDVHLRGALVDHADVDPRLVQRAKEPRRNAEGANHALANGGDQRHVGMHLDALRLAVPLDFAQNLLEMFLELDIRNDKAHGVDTAGHMLKGDVVAIQHAQQTIAETDLVVHVVFVD